MRGDVMENDMKKIEVIGKNTGYRVKGKCRARMDNPKYLGE